MKDPVDVREYNTTLFSCLSIETGAKCNRRCCFCPVSHAPREDEWMPMPMIEKILADLVRVGYRQRIVWHSYNEPMRDERLLEIITMFRAALPKTCMMFNTNGDYIKDPNDIAKYYNAGLNQMQINVYSAGDGSDNAERVANGLRQAEKRHAELQAMVDSLPWIDQNASIYQHIGARNHAGQVVGKYGMQRTDSHDNHAQKPLQGKSKRHHIANRAGTIPNFMPALDAPLDKMCVRPFREAVVNWRGDMILCCNDYYASASAGNVMDRTLEELFNDERYHAYRVKLQEKRRDIHLCDKCDYDGGFYQHNVPHVTFGDARDAGILFTDMRAPEAAGFSQLVQIGKRS